MKNSALSELARHTPEPAISWLMKLTLDRPDLISLAAGFTDNASLPLEETRTLLDGLLSKPSGRSALQYGTTAGDPQLRELTASHLRRADGVKNPETHAAERMLISSGSQQLLYMLTEALCDPGDLVLVEDPTYFVYLGITQSHRLRCRGVRLGKDGIELEHLEEILVELKRSGDLKKLKALYLVTYFQNPTGRTTSLEKKRGALEILRRYEADAGHPLYLVEDAAYRELRFSGKDVASALTTPYAERVLYAGTYSKPFATGARVGFGVLPEPIFTAVARIKGNHDFGTANLLQQLISRALSSGMYDLHLPALRERYAKKAARMVTALKAHFPGEVEWGEPRGGLYVWARLPKPLASGVKSALFTSALDANVLYVPGELCYCEDETRRKPNREMRLSFGGARESDIGVGIERLAAAIRKAGRK